MATLPDLDDQVFSIPCNCGQKIDETVRRLKTNPDLLCPACGTTIHVNADEFTRGIERVEKMLDELATSLGRIGKRR